MPTDENDAVGYNGNVGTPRPSPERIVREQEARYGGLDDRHLIAGARDRFDQCAVWLHDNAPVEPRSTINAVYRLSGEARAMLEVLARRWMNPTQRNREEADESRSAGTPTVIKADTVTELPGEKKR